FHISSSLSRRERQGNSTVRTDTACLDEVKACAGLRETWIRRGLVRIYRQIYERGFAHSLEVWDEDTLIGGVFGLTLGRAFVGESMFSRRTDASKVALAYLVDRLRLGGFTLFDTQFLTPHLASLGGVEITRDAYRRRLSEALI